MALTTAARFAFPALPTPPSWYPGHMAQFQNMLPTLLSRTDIVLELRDARLPLTSINRTFEGWFFFCLVGLWGFVVVVFVVASLSCFVLVWSSNSRSLRLKNTVFGLFRQVTIEMQVPC